MAMVVFKVEPTNAALIQQLTADDTVSRQSIHTRDAKALGMSGTHLFVRVQGSDAGVMQAKMLASKAKIGEVLPGPDAEKVSRAIDAEEDAAAEGMGMIFGG